MRRFILAYTKITKEKGQNSLTRWHIVIVLAERRCTCTNRCCCCCFCGCYYYAQLHNIPLSLSVSQRSCLYATMCKCVQQRGFIHTGAAAAVPVTVVMVFPLRCRISFVIHKVSFHSGRHKLYVQFFRMNLTDLVSLTHKDTHTLMSVYVPHFGFRKYTHIVK